MATDGQRPDPKTMRFEEVTAELEAIIERIEEGEIGLEASLAERTRGEALIKRAQGILAKAGQELEETTPERLEAEAGAGAMDGDGEEGTEGEPS